MNQRLDVWGRADRPSVRVHTGAMIKTLLDRAPLFAECILSQALLFAFDGGATHVVPRGRPANDTKFERGNIVRQPPDRAW